MTTTIPYIFMSGDHTGDDMNIVRIIRLNNRTKDLFLSIHYPHLALNAFYGHMVRQHIENNLIHHQNANPDQAFDHHLAIKASSYFFGLLDRTVTCRTASLSQLTEAVLKADTTKEFPALNDLLNLADKAINEVSDINMPRDNDGIYLMAAFIALTINLALQHHMDSDIINTMMNVEKRINPVVL